MALKEWILTNIFGSRDIWPTSSSSTWLLGEPGFKGFKVFMEDQSSIKASSFCLESHPI